MSEKEAATKKEWRIWFKHKRLWKGWKWLISTYGGTKQEALSHGIGAMYYYEGTTAVKVTQGKRSKCFVK